MIIDIPIAKHPNAAHGLKRSPESRKGK